MLFSLPRPCRYLNKEIAVKFNGGREVTGQLKGFDQLMNLVLDDVKEVTTGKIQTRHSIDSSNAGLG